MQGTSRYCTYGVVGEQPRVSVQDEPSVLPTLHEFTSLEQRAIEEARCGGRGGHRWGADVLHMFSITLRGIHNVKHMRIVCTTTNQIYGIDPIRYTETTQSDSNNFKTFRGTAPEA